MTRVVTRADRLRDVMALLVFLAGVALYAYAWTGMHDLATKHLVVQKGTPAMHYFDRYWQMSRVARLIMLAGAATVVWSFWSHRRRRDETA